MVTAVRLTTTETRAACTTRESWSRPRPSAPSGCARLGPSSFDETSGRSGSASGSHSANSALPKTSTSQPTASQKAMPCLRRRRPAGRLPGEAVVSPGSDAAPEAPVDAGSGPSTARSSGCSAAMADPRVEQRVEHVDDEVDDDERDGDHQRDALHHQQVALEDRVDEQAPDAGEGEQGLDDDR